MLCTRVARVRAGPGRLSYGRLPPPAAFRMAHVTTHDCEFWRWFDLPRPALAWGRWRVEGSSSSPDTVAGSRAQHVGPGYEPPRGLGQPAAGRTCGDGQAQRVYRPQGEAQRRPCKRRPAGHRCTRRSPAVYAAVYAARRQVDKYLGQARQLMQVEAAEDAVERMLSAAAWLCYLLGGRGG